MLEIKQEQSNHKACIFGKNLVLREPTYKEAMEYGKSIEGLSDEERGEVFIQYLEKLGLPKDCSEKMTPYQIEQVSELIIAPKKK